MSAVRVVDEHLLSPVLVYSGSGGVFENELELDTRGGIIREQIGNLLIVRNDFNVVPALTGSVFTGPVVFSSGLTGSLQTLSDGTPYIRGAGGVDVTSGSDGSVTISTNDTLVTLESLESAQTVSFGGDVYIEGTLYGGSPLDIASNVNVIGSIYTSAGITGSLTSLTDGTSYLVAGPGISISTGSRGQVTIAATSVTDAGNGSNSAGVVTDLVLNEIPAGAIDGVNKQFLLASTPSDSASVMVWLNGQLLSQGSERDYTVSGKSILFERTSLEIGDTLVAMYPRSVFLKKFALNEMATIVSISGSLGLRIEKTPDPVQSLMVFRNGQLLTFGADYFSSENFVQMIGGGIADDDVFLVTYSYSESPT